MNREGHAVQDYQLASLGIRALATTLDFIVSFCAVLITVFMLSKFEVVETIVSTKPSFQYNLIVVSISFTIFLLIQGYFLFKNSQTIGKMATNIKILGVNGRPINFLKLITMRYAAIFLISLLPKIGSLILLIGYLLIFTENRRCLHDLLAGTKVVDLNSNPLNESKESKTFI